MAFSSIVRALGRSPLTTELLSKLKTQTQLQLNGIPRLPKGLVASALANSSERNLFVVCATLEEAGRWTTQLEAMGWKTIHFYPTSEASPYEPFDPETEMTWGQMQVLADLIKLTPQPEKSDNSDSVAVIATQAALQPHLPPPEAFKPFCLNIAKGMEFNLGTFAKKMAALGYERVPLVEMEGTWSRRGDIVDVFPVSSELPVRLDWFGDEIEQIREFDPSTQRSALDKIDQIILTPTSFAPILMSDTQFSASIENYLSPEEKEQLESGQLLEGTRRFLGVAYEKPASLLDYLPENTLVAVDEIEQCYAHSLLWVENAQEQWLGEGEGERGRGGEGGDNNSQLPITNYQLPITNSQLPKIHRFWEDCLADLDKFESLYLSEIAEEGADAVNLAARSIPVTPHAFAKLAEVLREERDRNFNIWLASAQPTRSVSLLQEHDCPAQFIPNPRDYQAIDRSLTSHVPVAVKYSGLAELEGFILPTFRIVVVTDKEFYGQHTLATPGYVRKRRKASSKKVDPNKLRPGDYVIHRNHGLGQFLKLESLTLNHETRDYLVVKYADGLLRVAADQVGALSRFRTTTNSSPQLNKMTGKAWENTKNKVRKTVKKLAVDLLRLYSQRTQQTGFTYPQDSPWQEEMEDSFPYQPTIDQLKATQDVKRDMESERPDGSSGLR